MGRKVCLRCKGKTLLGVVNKLLKTKSLLTSPSNVLPLHPKQTFRLLNWIFTQDEGDGIEFRISSLIFSTLLNVTSFGLTCACNAEDLSWCTWWSTIVCSFQSLFLPFFPSVCDPAMKSGECQYGLGRIQFCWPLCNSTKALRHCERNSQHPVGILEHQMGTFSNSSCKKL